jgi:hypothetical protein
MTLPQATLPHPLTSATLSSAPRVSTEQEGSSKVVVWAVRVAVAGLVGSMTLGAVDTATASTLSLSARTITPQIRSELLQPTPAAPAASTAGLVNKLHTQSGLTWDQVGRLLGVSRRAVHMWAAGKRMNARNAELLADLVRLVDMAPVGTPDERRSWLFTATADGVTPIERFLSQHRQPGQPLSGSGYTAAQLLGITTD